jgi:pimeloyl-ACP methyl ester carboxylesterase
VTTPSFQIRAEWLHIQHEERVPFAETYGFSGNQGVVNLEGILMAPNDRASTTLFVFMHPTSTLHLLPVPRSLAQLGAHVLCAGSRYAKNDSALILEKVVLDLGAYIRHCKKKLGYQKIVLAGWSGGGSLAAFYQAEAEQPQITHTPAGDTANIKDANLIPADAVIFQAAHLSRARVLLEWIDPSVKDELNPDDRDAELDLYDPTNRNQPPYSPDFIAMYRATQMARMQRITTWVKQTLKMLKDRNSPEKERGFVVHRTMADPRFLDATLDPNDRRPKWCYMGDPETVNTGPVGLARFSTLRSWLSQWSIEDTQGDALGCAARIGVPVLVIENSADDAVPQPHPGLMFSAVRSSDKIMQVIKNATHYYADQPELLAKANMVITNWLADQRIGI